MADPCLTRYAYELQTSQGIDRQHATHCGHSIQPKPNGGLQGSTVIWALVPSGMVPTIPAGPPCASGMHDIR
jgi:hypothetical protein